MKHKADLSIFHGVARKKPFGRRNILLGVLAALFICPPAMGQQKPAFVGDPSQQAASQPVPPFSGQFTAKDVDNAVKRAIDFLWSQQTKDGNWPELDTPNIMVGTSDGTVITKYTTPGVAPCVMWALLESGVDIKDHRMQKALNWLARARYDRDWVYNIAARCNVWAEASKQDPQYKKLLNDEVMKLVNGTSDGAYGYWATGEKSRPDNSNVQFALLGVWSAALAGAEFKPQFWEIMLKYWFKAQNKDGGWGYYPLTTETFGAAEELRKNSYPHMTVAGLASLFVCVDNMYRGQFDRCSVPSEVIPVTNAMNWLEKYTDAAGIDTDCYLLFGICRIGMACGFKYIGKIDWYKQGAIQIMKAQKDDGSVKEGWSGNASSSTALALLFLIRGRNPVLFNRLQYDGEWNNRPRAFASLCRWLSKYLEKSVSWQIVNFKMPPEDWHDAPILAITGSKKPNFTDKDLAKLRDYVLQGGTIFTNVECNGKAFEDEMKKVYQKLFPKYELAACQPDHPIFSVHYKLLQQPKIFELTNGVRPLVIHCQTDMPVAWQLDLVATRKDIFEAGSNVAMYLTDKGRLQNRGEIVWPDKPLFQPQGEINVARVKYAGNWDPEPLALERFSRILGLDWNIRVNIGGPAELADLPAARAGKALTTMPASVPASAPAGPLDIAFMTGTAAFTLEDRQKEAIKKFVADGGMLVIDAAGGNQAFTDSARAALEEIFGQDSVVRIPAENNLYTLGVAKIDKCTFQRRTAMRMGKDTLPRLLTAARQGHNQTALPDIIFSPEDITSALMGIALYNSDGYSSGSAYELARNIAISVFLRKAAVAAAEAKNEAATSSAPASQPQTASAPASEPASRPLLVKPATTQEIPKDSGDTPHGLFRKPSEKDDNIDTRPATIAPPE
ncbi:MAG: DUF4159 domain-containing protein [Planctomycetes bacterium]|nr:DUF4159 domain-containing protein [Planctomycetota bacterium]